MHKWKRFVKGPGLHDELSNPYQQSNTVRPTNDQGSQESLDGNSAKAIYEAIVNEPSSSCCASGSSTKVPRQVREVPPPRRLRLVQLMGLCESNDIEELSRYIECYCNELEIDAVDQYGWTLLMSAACSGSVDCVALLLRAGSDWTLKDKSGLTAFHLAQKKHKTNVCELIENWGKLCQTKKQEQGRSSSGAGESSDEEGESVSKFCEPCNIDYSDERKHSRSIAHLLCTSNYSENEKVHYGIPESNKGFQLMLKTGWDRRGLGVLGEGQKFPVKTVLKRDRKGLGQTGRESERKAAKITHFGPFDTAAVERTAAENRLERFGTVQRKKDERRRNKQKVKEIEYRRELGSI